jgi:hypothetical protein
MGSSGRNKSEAYATDALTNGGYIGLYFGEVKLGAKTLTVKKLGRTLDSERLIL